MEHLTAALAALLLWLFLCHCKREGKKRASQKAGRLLGRFARSRSLAGWCGELACFALATAPWAFIVCLGGCSESMSTFNLVFFGLEYNPFSWGRDLVEFHEGGILTSKHGPFQGNVAVFTAWASIEYCKWTKLPGSLCVTLHDSIRVLPKGSIPQGQMEEATAILRRYVKVADAERRVLNPEFKPAERPAGAEPAELKYGRFQFSLRTLLFFMLVASAGMSWYGIGYRRDAAEQAILVQLARFTPRNSGVGDHQLLDFSASPVKPGDADLEPLSKLSRLEDLDLSGAPVTDAGLKHLEPLARLRYLHLEGTAITDVGLAHLEKLTSLRILTLWNTRVTDAGVKRLQPALPNTKIYH